MNTASLSHRRLHGTVDSYIDYVIAFTELADGDSEQIIAATPVLVLAQLLLPPGYL